MGVPGTDDNRGERMWCSGEVFYVDPNFPGASDARDGTSPTDPLATVAAAITKVQSQRGDVIVVMQNDYWQYAAGGGGVSTDYVTPITEEVTIPYTAAGVRIIGLSNSSIGVMWQPASNAGTCITVHAIDVVIEGFVFTEGDYTGCDAIYCEWDGATLFGENMTVRNCVFDDTVDTAIQLEYSWYCDIHHNYFQENDVVAIMTDVGGSGTAYCRIHDNVFHNCTAAMSMLGGFDDNQIYGNSIFNANAQAAAAAVNEGINTTGGTRNQVFNNWFSCLDSVPANGDWDNLNTAAATDAWIHNHLMDAMNTANPT
jgi:hypothetical protein